GVPADLVEDVELRKPLADVRVLVSTDVLGELLEQVRLPSGDGALGAVAPPPRGEISDAPLELLGLLARHRPADGSAPTTAEVGGLPARCPYLLPVHDPFVAVALGAALEAREVGAGAGLTEQLTPRFLPVQDRPQVSLSLRVVAVGQDRRAGQQHPES